MFSSESRTIMVFPAPLRFITFCTLILLPSVLSSCLDFKFGEEPVPGSECVKIAQSLAYDANNNRPDNFDAFVDYERYIDRMLERIPANPIERERFSRDIRSSISIGEYLCEQIRGGGECTLLHMRTVEGEPRVLVRTRREDGSIGYYDFIFGYREGAGREPGVGDIALRDIYLYSDENLMSDIMRRNVQVTRKSTFLESLTGKERDTSYREVTKIADSMHLLLAQGEAAKIRTMYKTLPSRLQSNKLILVYRVHASRMGGEEEFLHAVNDYVRYNPAGVATELLLMEKNRMTHQYNEVLRSIERLDSLIGGDPYLRYYRGMVYLTTKDTTKAIQWMKSAIKEEPMLEDPYWPLICMQVGRRDFSGAIPYLNALALWFGKPVDELEMHLALQAGADRAFDEFTKSEKYRKWRNKRLGIIDSTEAKEPSMKKGRTGKKDPAKKN